MSGVSVALRLEWGNFRNCSERQLVSSSVGGFDDLGGPDNGCIVVGPDAGFVIAGPNTGCVVVGPHSVETSRKSPPPLGEVAASVVQRAVGGGITKPVIAATEIGKPRNCKNKKRAREDSNPRPVA